MMKSMLISIIMGMMKSIITKMIIISIIRSIIRSIMNMIRLGIRRMISSKNKIIRRKRLEMGRMNICSTCRISPIISITIPQSHLIPHYFSPPVGTSSALRFLPPVLPNISMTISRLTLPAYSIF